MQWLFKKPQITPPFDKSGATLLPLSGYGCCFFAFFFVVSVYFTTNLRPLLT